MTEQQINFTVSTSGERLDKLVVEQVGDSLSRAQIQAMIKDGKVTVNGAQVKSGIKLKGGEQISVTIATREETETVVPEAIAPRFCRDRQACRNDRSSGRRQ